MQFRLERSNVGAVEISAKESAVNFLTNTNKVYASSSDVERQHLVKGRELGLIDLLTSDGDINRSAEGVGRYNQCMTMLNQPPTNKAFSYLNLTVLQAMDQRGASYTSGLEICGHIMALPRRVKGGTTLG